VRERLITVLLFLAVVAGTCVTVMIAGETVHVLRAIQARDNACEICTQYFQALQQQRGQQQQQGQSQPQQ
jgi:hypothetical protein